MTIPIVSRVVPTTSAQRRLWLGQQLEPESPVYNRPAALRLRGTLQRDLLERALDRVAERHETLRTSFAFENGEPVQVIGSAVRIPLSIVDLEATSCADREAAIANRAAWFAAEPFDLTHPPLLRAEVLRLSDSDHVLLVVGHHLISDGWSYGVLFREIAELYEAATHGLPDELPELQIQYSDVAALERSPESIAAGESDLAYWVGALDGAPPFLPLPADFPGEPTLSAPALRVPLEFRPELCAAVVGLARGARSTPVAVVLAAFASILGRAAGQDDVIVGTVIARRDRTESAGLIGLFAGLLPLRLRPRREVTFRALVDGVGEALLGAAAHTQSSFDEIVDVLRPPRRLGTNPLVQVALVAQAEGHGRRSMGNVTVEPIPIETGVTELDLTLWLDADGNQLKGALEARADRFAAETLKRLAVRLIDFLTVALALPETTLGNLPAISSEDGRLLAVWNQSGSPSENDVLLHEVFASVVLRTPEATAVVAEGRRLSYRELDEASNRFAHHLCANGVHVGDRIAVCVDRSAEMVVVLMAILKVGAAFVPLDPRYPVERLQRMLEHAAPVLLVSDAPKFALSIKTINLGAEALSIAGRSSLPVSCPSTLHGALPAYLLYTSGSSGTPKGVEIPHASVVNLLASAAEAPGFGPDDVLLAVTTLSFDIAILELFLPLTRGGTVAVCDSVTAADGVLLAAALRDTGATLMQATPATWQMLLASGWPGDPRLRVLSGGEELSRDLANTLLGCTSEVWNMYGPTETTIWSAVHRVAAGVGRVPIGSPMRAQSLHVLDAWGDLAPPGTEGELFIGGAGVGLGYLRDPAGTAARFLPDPFSNRPGARLYRTGDLVVRRAEGELVFLGRLDGQVKVRGFRIETAEVELTLRGHSAVGAVVVRALRDHSGDARLVAFVVPDVDHQQPPIAEALRQHLSALLPPHLVPDEFVLLDRVPYTPNGKVDSQALAAARLGRRHESDRRRPGPGIEAALAALWAEVLDRSVTDLRAQDDFFAIGGHSLGAARLLTRVRSVFGAELRIRQVFENPTIERQALLLTQLSVKPVPSVAQEPRTALPPPLSLAQRRMWLLHELDPGDPSYHIAGAVAIRGNIDVTALRDALGDIVRRHEALRTTFVIDLAAGAEDAASEQERVRSAYVALQAEPVQVIHQAPFRPTEMFAVTDLRALPPAMHDSAVMEACAYEVRRPFDLARGPLLRFRAIALADDEYRIVITIHHAVADEWSISILLRELGAAYSARRAGVAPNLPELRYQYADYVGWERAYLSVGRLEELGRYWSEQLRGARPLLTLPLDRPRPAVRSSAGARVPVVVPPTTFAAVHALARAERATPFMVLLAALTALLSRYSGEDDIVIGSPIVRRPWPELEQLIGLFVNTLVVRVDLAGDPDFRSLVGRTRQTLLDAYAHQDMPFERLVDELEIPRSRSHTPVVQVLFAYQNVPEVSVQIEGTEVTEFALETGTVMSDLRLILADGVGAEGVCASGWLEYATDLFDFETANAIARRFLAVLEHVTLEPEVPLSAIRLATPQESAAEFRGAHVSVADSVACLHDLFAERARVGGDRIAVTHQSESITYRALDAEATRLAHRLRAAGVGPEDVVGILLDRSIAWIVSIIGVLRAGGAYLPLDPSYPDERIALLLADAGAGWVVADDSLARRCPSGVQWIDPSEGSDCEAPEAIEPRATPANLAYVIYTSGSSGTPKGVEICHQQVSSLLSSCSEVIDTGPEDVWALFHAFTFDFSVWEIWGALLHGGRLVIVSDKVRRDPEAFHGLIASEGVTVLSQTPSAFRRLIDAEQRLGPAGPLLRWVIFGGEALDLSILEPWYARRGGGGPVLVNMYGITETTVHVTARTIALRDVRRGQGSVIGVPLSRWHVLLLDSRQQPVPPGILGEMFVGGLGVARGYRRRQDLTAERFVPHPTVPGARLYRSGDLARRLPTGELIYQGRADEQLKIRGFRVEPGEIVTVLCRHADVAEALVIGSEVEDGDRRLVAFVKWRSGALQDPERLRELLRSALPEHMLPSSFVALDHFPLTPNGKIDRRSLPAATGERTERSRSVYIAPSGLTEKVLSNAWAAVLGLERVGIDDNFFALGGDSLVSVRMLTYCRSEGLSFKLALLFDHQTVRELAAAIDAAEPVGSTADDIQIAAFDLVSPEQRARIPETVVDAYPLAAMQSGMIYHSLADAGAALYHNIDSFRVRLDFRPDAMRVAIARLIGRHPVLRTSFDLVSFSEPLQLVHREGQVPLEIVDLQRLEASAQERALREWAEQETRRGFDIGEPTLLRFCVHQLSADTIQFSVTQHHAILDGWSIATMLAELFGTYVNAIAINEPPRIAYRDFVAAERRQRSSDSTAQFWREYLENYSAAKLFPPAEVPGTLADGQQMLHLDVDAGLVGRLRDVAREAGANLKSAFLGAHFLVLSLLHGHDDVVTGVVADGRPEVAGGEEVLGLFLNTIPMRLRSFEGTPIALVRAVFAEELAVRPHRRYPAAQIQADAGQRQLFETLFTYTQFHPLKELHKSRALELLGGFSFAYDNFTLAANFDVDPSDERKVRFSIGYDALVIDSTRARAIGGYYLEALDAIADVSGARIVRDTLLSQVDRRVAAHWRRRAEAATPGTLIHQLVVDHAQRQPDAVAIRFEGREVRYCELEERTARIAMGLRGRGIGRESVVGICLPRSEALPIACLGVLRAGAAFLPLDPELPADRLRWMIEDASAAIVVCDPALEEQIGGCGASSISLTALESTAAGPLENVDDMTGSALAYVIYTSGSTGLPKAAMVEHVAALNSLAGYVEAYGLEAPGTRHLQMASFSFDAFVGDLLRSLCTGGQLTICPRHLLVDPPALLGLMRRERITHAEFVPQVVRGLIRYAADEQQVLDRPTTMVVSSDRWTVGEYVRIRDVAAGDLRLFNAYGLTEAAIDSASFVGDVTREPLGALVPIDRVFPNTSLYVLGRDLCPVPVETAGELYIGGVGLARGYRSQPALTAARFMPDPFSDELGGRMYRTGDLAELRRDGRLRLLGRSDDQVKVRGFRIELGEIERCLDRHPGIRQGVVVAQEMQSFEKQLVAHYVPSTDPGPSVADLRAHLKRSLPEYMVPIAFVAHKLLPMTSSGKVNRRALPVAMIASSSAEDCRPLATPEEYALAAIWADVLGVGAVSASDNFFELGGDSILMIQVIARARRAGLALDPRLMFAAPNLQELASRVGYITSVNSRDIAPVAGAIGLLPSQAWLFDKCGPFAAHFNLSQLFEARGNVDVAALERAVNHIVAHHEALRLRFSQASTGFGFTQEVVSPAALRVPFHHIIVPSTTTAAEIETRIKSETSRLQASFDLARPPLFAVAYFDLGSQTSGRIFLAVHHLIVDWVSWRILLEDLETAYAQCLAGRQVELPETTTSFARWATRLCDYAQTADVVGQLDHWCATATGDLATIPLDFVGGSNLEATAQKISVFLDPRRTRALIRGPNRKGTVPELLLAAMATAIAAWIPEARRVQIDLEGHGREPIFEDIDLSRTVGWFTAIYPVAIPLVTTSAQLEAVRSALGAVPMGGLGYGLLRYCDSDGQSARRLMERPMSPISWNYLGEFDTWLERATTFGVASESVGPGCAPGLLRAYVLEVDSLVVDGSLRTNFTFSAQLHRPETVQRLADCFLAAIVATLN